MNKTRRELIMHLVFSSEDLTQEELEFAVNYHINDIRNRIKSSNQGIFGWDIKNRKSGSLVKDHKVEWCMWGD